MAYLTKSYVLMNSLTFFLAILPKMQPEGNVHPAAVEVQRPNYWITYFSFAALLCSFFCVLSQLLYVFIYVFPGEGNGNPLQCSCPENPMDRGTWQATVHGVSKSQNN